MMYPINVKQQNRIAIKSEPEHLVVGEVYVPWRLDTDGEFMRPEEIEKAAHRFMEYSKTANVDQEHSFEKTGCKVVEVYIAKEGDPTGFIPGSFIAATKIHPNKWDDVQKGIVNGYSMAGTGRKISATVSLTALKTMKRSTEDSLIDALPAHSHEFNIEFADEGSLVPSYTSVTLDHKHKIEKTTATELELDHAHRFDIHWTDKDENITTEKRTEDVTELVDVYPKWISLVEHGAVRRGFKIVKSEVRPMDRIVHAIIVSKGQKLEELAVDENLKWLANPQLQIIKKDSADVADTYVFVPVEEFQIDSLKQVAVAEGKAQMIVGILKSDRKDVVQITKDYMDSVAGLPYAPSVPTVEERFVKEMMGLQGVILGALQQSGSNGATLKKTINSAVDAFKTFAVSCIDSNVTKGQEVPEMNKEETTALVQELLDAKIPAMLDAKVPEMLKAELDPLKVELLDAIKKGNEEPPPADGKTTKGEDVIAKQLSELTASVTAQAENLKTLTEQHSALVAKSDEQKETLDRVSRAASVFPGVFSPEEDPLAVEKAAVKEGEVDYRGTILDHFNPKIRAILARQ